MHGNGLPFTRVSCGRGWLYQVRGAAPLSGPQLESAFEQLSEHPAERAEDGALARGKTLRVLAADGATIRLRLYRRGGLLRKCNRMTFLRTNANDDRLARELEILCYLRQQGVPVTEPRGGYLRSYLGIWYRCMLATTEIADADTLLSRWRASAISNDEIRTSARALGVMVRRLLALGVWHRDLHPANVLRLDAGSLVLLDFDKAERFTDTQEGAVCERYLSRWRRACNKHLLEERRAPAIEGFQRGVMQ